MLGLVGEAGEVLAEVSIPSKSNMFVSNIQDLIKSCKTIEYMKKRIREKSMDEEISLLPSRQDLFNKELADVFYYLNILATNRGLTIFDLAQMAHDKVRAKQVAGGSSEDHKKS